MFSLHTTRRRFAAVLASVLSGMGLEHEVSAKAEPAEKNEVQKLNEEGKPANGKQMITPIIVHNGLIYVAGQGAHDTGPQQQWMIEGHTRTVMDKVKALVERAGGTMDTVLQLTVFLAKIEDYEHMNSVFKTYFPNGGPARTTIAVAALPGNSLVEINCIATVARH